MFEITEISTPDVYISYIKKNTLWAMCRVTGGIGFDAIWIKTARDNIQKASHDISVHLAIKLEDTET